MTRLKVVRSDAFPEGNEYRDEGCDLSPSCLSCPLPRCRYEMSRSALNTLRNGQRDERIRTLYAAGGTTVRELAHRFGMSVRQVHRVLAPVRSARRAA